MSPESKKQVWALVQSPEFVEACDGFSSKYRSQIARKAQDLTRNPRPGGSRTSLKGYPGLCRVRAGDFRIIYAYNEEVVQVLTLRRRDESTYDDLDAIEVAQLASFKGLKGNNDGGATMPDWKSFAEKWLQPTAKPHEKLPEQITLKLLEGLDVPKQYWQPLLEAVTVEDLLECPGVPDEHTAAVLERLCPKKEDAPKADPTPVIVIEDLVDPVAAVAGGPIGFEEPPMPKEKSGKALIKLKVPAPLVLVATKRLQPMKPYSGNAAKAIGKETKYTVKLDGTIRLIFGAGDNERALLTTDEHPELAELVNEAKKKGGGDQGGGGFLINEYRHVLVPTLKGGVLFAGHYTKDLEFSFNGRLVSPVAPRGIRSGAVWPGPHVGVRYTLAAGAKDIRYDAETTRGTIKQMKLTDIHDADALDQLLGMCRAVKPSGGAIYINEARELFAPVEEKGDWKRRYIGHLGRMPWFPEPS